MRVLWLFLLLALAGCGTAPVALPPSAPTLAPVGTFARAGRSGPSATVNSVPVVLNAGWNPVGFQAQRLTALAGTGLVAGQASWNGTAYITGNLDTSLSGRLGYWIFAREATTFTYSGADDGSGAYVDLPFSGYNLVSFCTNLELPTSSLVATRNGAAVPLNSVVLTQFFELQTNNTYATVEVPGGVIKPGRPYWIFAREPVRLSWNGGPSASPSPSPSASPAASPAASAPPAASPAASPSPTPGASPSPGASPVATRLLYVRDRLTDAATIASLQDGTTTVPAAGSGQSQPVVSDDGDTIVFVSSASNLVPGYSGSGAQVYLRRRSTNRTILVSRSAASATAGGNGESVFPRVSADGSKVAFESEATDLLASLSGRQIVVATVGPTGVSAMTQRSGNADQPCRLGGMTSDGSAVIFRTAATNLAGPALGPAANARLFVSDAGGLRFVAQTDSFSSLFAEAALSDAGNAFWGAGVDPQTGVADGGGQGLYRLAGGSYARLAAAQVLSLGVDRTGARACYFDLGSFTVPTVDLVTGALTGTLPGGDSASSFQPCSLAAGGGLGGYLSSSGSFLLSPVP